MIESFFFYVASVWGLTHILVSSKILSSFRDWLLIEFPFFGELFNCYQCTSFWVSMLMYFLFENLRLNTIKFEIYNIELSPDFLIWGFIGSGIVSFLSVFLSLMIKMSKKDI
jgi:hypothetical protein